MGTRRSRHNKGRKPKYKDHGRAEVFALDRPYYPGGLLLNTRLWWTPEAHSAMEEFAERGVAINAVAAALGRSPKSIANRAIKQAGLKVPDDWTALVRTRRERVARALQLAYPYIIRPRDEHADILAINSLVPHAFPDQMRADICQEIALAMLEGTVTIADLKENRTKAAWFYKRFWMQNYEDSGKATSLDATRGGDWSNADAIASVAAKEWHHGQVIERQSGDMSLGARFQAPTQLEHVWQNQVEQVRAFHAANGKPILFDEAAAMLDNGYRLPDAGRSHASLRAEERHGLRLDRRAREAIRDRIESGECLITYEENANVCHARVAYGGKALKVVYSRFNQFIMTVYPADQAGEPAYA